MEKINHISFDVTDAKECAVPKEMFRIIKYNACNGMKFEDLVHDGVPFIHFQVLRPTNGEQRKKALSYFKGHDKFFVSFIDREDILLYLGCTNNIYIKSGSVECGADDIMSIQSQAAHWFRFYGSEEHSNNNQEQDIEIEGSIV